MNTLHLRLEHVYHHTIGNSAGLYYVLENGETDFVGSVDPKWMYEWLYVVNHYRWAWLQDIRKEQRFINLVDCLRILGSTQ